jgi:single-strand DNA-binding protein
MYINKVFLYGNLTRDPELKALPSGSQVASFGIATNRTYKDKDGNKQEQVEFHNITLFGKQAEIAHQYLKKGRPVFVEGRMQTRSWDDKETGKKMYRTEVIVDNFQFGPTLAPSADGQKSGHTGDAAAEPTPAAKAPKVEYPEEDINPEDIPF